MNTEAKLIIIATNNPGKVREFANWFKHYGVRVQSLADFENVPEIVEDGDTFAANARIKAEKIARHLQLPVLADDSGLCVGALGGAPGVYSARYAGEHGDDAANNAKLLRELAAVQAAVPSAAGHPDASLKLLSSAHFVCALALVDPLHNIVLEVEGCCSGFIQSEPRGSGGFGYDPLFYLPEFKQTMAEIPLEVKNEISHRAQALKRFSSDPGFTSYVS